LHYSGTKTASRVDDARNVFVAKTFYSTGEQWKQRPPSSYHISFQYITRLFV